MGFHAPTLPLKCNVFQGQGSGPAPPSTATQTSVQCQLRLPRGTPTLRSQTLGSAIIMLLVLPARTDIRAARQGTPNSDAVEVPAGSGRFYTVLAADDSAKGFPNESRIAIISTQPNFAGWWPYPTP